MSANEKTNALPPSMETATARLPINMRSAKAALKITLFLLWIAIWIPPQALVLFFHKGRGAYIIPLFWHKGVCKIFGIRCEIRGAPNKGHQTLYMSNHLSYLDVSVLASILPAAFLAKQEVESWAVFGLLSKLQQCAYIERRRTAIAGEKSKLDKFLDTGRSLILFPEGTSTSGMSIFPFKTSLFSLAENRSIDIQPVTLALVETNGKKCATKEEFDLYAWPLEMETPLPTHLWQFAHTSGARLIITFHPVIRADKETDRKTLAKTCHDSVCKGLEV
jgi:1-acyl-sn-glycerol-3-phosphate acyltransferase